MQFKKKLQYLVMAGMIPVLTACGGSSDSDSVSINNLENSYAYFTEELGYAGGDVLFGGERIEGEWSNPNIYGSDLDFFSHDRYLVLGIKFDYSYYEYWSDIYDGAFTRTGSYGVSQDGLTLAIKKYSGETMFFNYVKSDGDCIETNSNEDKKVLFCKVSN